MEQKQRYNQDEFDFNTYNWNPTAKAGADGLNRKKWLLKAFAILCILAAAYVQITRNIWGLGTLFSQLLAIVELETGAWMVIRISAR